MYFEDEINGWVAEARRVPASPLLARQAIALLDLTSLNDTDTAEGIADLCGRVVTPFGPVAAVCVFPRFLPLVQQSLVGTTVRVATVINFPEGQGDIAAVQAEADSVMALGAQEIDVVIPYRQAREGYRHQVRELLRGLRHTVGEGFLLKAILETGELGGAEDIRSAAEDAITGGADFIQTSTGKTPVSATHGAAAVMMKVSRELGSLVGIKIVGGVSHTAQAVPYLALADIILGRDWAQPSTFRFGASALLDDLRGHGRAEVRATGLGMARKS